MTEAAATATLLLCKHTAPGDYLGDYSPGFATTRLDRRGRSSALLLAPNRPSPRPDKAAVRSGRSVSPRCAPTDSAKCPDASHATDSSLPEVRPLRRRTLARRGQAVASVQFTLPTAAAQSTTSPVPESLSGRTSDHESLAPCWHARETEDMKPLRCLLHLHEWHTHHNDEGQRYQLCARCGAYREKYTLTDYKAGSA